MGTTVNASSPLQHQELEMQEAVRVQAASPAANPPLPPPHSDIDLTLQFQLHKAPVPATIVPPVWNQVSYNTLYAVAGAM